MPVLEFASAVTRRELGRVSVVLAAGSVLAACARLPMSVSGSTLVSSASTQAPPLKIASVPLNRVRDKILAQWKPSAQGFGIDIGEPTAHDLQTYLHSNDIIDFDPIMDDPRPYPVLDELLKKHNFDKMSLVSGALGPFASIPGGLRGLPYFLSEFAFYVNASRLAQLGVGTRTQWSLDTMTSALDVAIANGPSADTSPLIVGVDGGWTDVRMWGAFVLSRGGSLGPTDRIDFSGAVKQTLELVDFARRYRWDPPGSRRSFEQSGFSGSAANALFAFLQPWTATLIGLPAPLSSSAVPSVPTSSFPLLGTPAVVPEFSAFGFVVSPYCQNQDFAVKFLLWLYETDQQKLLAAAGYPPVVSSPSLRQFWGGVQGALDPGIPKFAFDGLVDVVDRFPHFPLGICQWCSYSFGIQRALQNIYNGADADTELGKAAQTLEQQLATSQNRASSSGGASG